METRTKHTKQHQKNTLQRKSNTTKRSYEAVDYQVSTYEGIPVMETISAEEHKEFVESGYGTISDLIGFNQMAYRDWQCDC